MMFADIATGNSDVADVLFLAAFILAVAGALYAVMQRAVATVITLTVLALVALAWMLL